MIRGVAAVAVLLFHVRYRFFLDYAEVSEPTVIARAWYALTAFGHDAVMVFFVVSGFLVGAAALHTCQTSHWRWGDYLTARAVRLYVVLLPGLLLTLLWDRLGLHLFDDSPIYTGIAQSYHHDFFDVAARGGVSTFIGNALFLQGIRVPTFGSNDALWSLSFEFWYYAVFPMLSVAAFSAKSWSGRAAYLAGASVLLFVIGDLAVYFPIWLMGVIVGTLPSSRAMSLRPVLYSGGAGMVFLVWLIAGHTRAVSIALGNSLWLADTLTGITFAAWLYSLLHDRQAASSRAYGRISGLVASVSYTLYVVHLPLLVFIRAWLVPGAPWAPTPLMIAAGCAVGVIAFAYAYVVARLTEFHTGRVRRGVDAWREHIHARWTVAVRTGRQPDLAGSTVTATTARKP